MSWVFLPHGQPRDTITHGGWPWMTSRRSLFHQTRLMKVTCGWIMPGSQLPNAGHEWGKDTWTTNRWKTQLFLGGSRILDTLRTSSFLCPRLRPVGWSRGTEKMWSDDLCLGVEPQVSFQEFNPQVSRTHDRVTATERNAWKKRGCDSWSCLWSTTYQGTTVPKLWTYPRFTGAFSFLWTSCPDTCPKVTAAWTRTQEIIAAVTPGHSS